MGLVPLDPAYPTTAESPCAAAAAATLDSDHQLSPHQSLGHHTGLQPVRSTHFPCAYLMCVWRGLLVWF